MSLKIEPIDTIVLNDKEYDVYFKKSYLMANLTGSHKYDIYYFIESGKYKITKWSDVSNYSHYSVSGHNLYYYKNMGSILKSVVHVINEYVKGDYPIRCVMEF